MRVPRAGGIAIVAAAVGLAAAAASAWCPVFLGGPGDANDYYAFEIENSATNWIATVSSPGLNNQVGTALYWRDVIEHVVDTAAQTWSRNGRVRVKVGYRGTFTGPPIPWGSDGRSAIVTEACPEPNAMPAFATYEQLFNPDSCDITIRRGGCIVVPWQLGSNSDAAGLDPANLARTIRHEMGHCMGLGEPALSSSGCDEYGNCGCANSWCVEDMYLGCTGGQLMCQASCLRKTEHPLMDDINGHHQKITGGGPPRREVVFGMATISSTNVFSDAETLNLIGGSVFPARIDCRKGTSTPDCVLARTYSTSTLKFDRITFAATSPLTFSDVGTTTVSFPYMTRSPDVAMGDAGTSVVVGYRSVAANIIGVEALRFSTSSGALLSSTQLDTSTDGDVTHHEARVVFVRGLGGTGRFVVALPRRTRQLEFYVSADAAGNGAWTELTRSGSTLHRVFDSFDLHCPRHQTAGSGDTSCRVVIGSNSLLNGGSQTCRLDFTTTSVAVSTCSGPFGAGKYSTPVALVDYGTGTPSSQRTATSWLLSMSRRSPDFRGYNTDLLVYLNAAVFQDPSLLIQEEHDLDFLGCSSFGLGDDAESYFGGTSVDYCEFCDRIVRVGMGDNLTGPTGDRCF